jgi:hypothetical protein
MSNIIAIIAFLIAGGVLFVALGIAVLRGLDFLEENDD